MSQRPQALSSVARPRPQPSDGSLQFLRSDETDLGDGMRDMVLQYDDTTSALSHVDESGFATFIRQNVRNSAMDTFDNSQIWCFGGPRIEPRDVSYNINVSRV